MTLGQFYSFDTSAYINGQRDQFPPDVVPTLWPQIDQMALLGEVQSVDLVREELSRRDDEVYAWAKARPHLFVPLTEDVQREVRRVLRRHPKLIGIGSGRSGADPFVIALAQVHSGTVVTDERPTRNVSNPRIPDVCSDLGVPCMSLVEFIRDRGWTFS